jgi:uncharacterized membrane protein
MSKKKSKAENDIAQAGLPGADPHVEAPLVQAGIDPDRLSIFKFGQKPLSVSPHLSPWTKRLLLGLTLWLFSKFLQASAILPESFFHASLSLIIGLIILQVACEALLKATEKIAARLHWNHYVAGTVAEILSTIPELVVIAFIIPVSPVVAFIITLITIYNNALVFSLYSYFLPKDRYGKFLMPKPITEAGTQILIGGGAMGLVLGLVMLAFTSESPTKNSFMPIDLFFISFFLLAIFIVYTYKLVTSYAQEEDEVRESLGMSKSDIRQRLDMVYEDVTDNSLAQITGLLLIGIIGAILGGEQVSEFARAMVSELDVNPILTALILAVFAGMSEYVIVWKSHQKKEYGIALANAFGGITQVMFLVFPFTLLCIAVYQTFINPGHVELPISFSLSNIFLLLFLFPTFYILTSLLEKDHTLGILDTVIMSGVFLFLIVLLVSYGASAG